jgi:uncharacterized membrane protein
VLPTNDGADRRRHGHDPDELYLPLRTRRVLAVVASALALFTLVGIVALRARESPRDRLGALGLESTFYDARVETVDADRTCETGGDPTPEGTPGAPVRCPQAWVRLLEGQDQGSTTLIDLPGGAARVRFSEGDKVVVAASPRPDGTTGYAFVDRQRKPVLLWLAAGFAIVVIALGRLRGLAALAGLVSSLCVLLAFILPAILVGHNPLLVAVVGSAAIAFLALYLAHGFRPATTVALLGTLASLAVTAVLALLVTKLAGLTGYASEEATFVQLAQSAIDLRGLVLAGVVIGALGAIDDMTVTQVAAVSELHRVNPRLGRGRLYRSAMRIGRDHVASTVNTLALAYAGASIPLLLLFVLSDQSLGSVANGEVVATEIVRTLVGSIGLVSAVPITTWLAVRALPDARLTRPEG